MKEDTLEDWTDIILGNQRKENESMKRQFFIAGVQFRPRAEISVAAKELKIGDKLLLVPEPTNKFDPNAVKIVLDYEESVNEDEEKHVSLFLGYVPKKYSSEISGLLSIDAPLICTVKAVDGNKSTWEMFEVEVGIPIDEDELEAEEDDLSN
jgi:hypothetical protein